MSRTSFRLSGFAVAIPPYLDAQCAYVMSMAQLQDTWTGGQGDDELVCCPSGACETRIYPVGDRST